MQTINSEIEMPLDRLDDDLGLLQELLGDEPAVTTTKPTSRMPAAVRVVDMSRDEFRAYKAEKQAERRARLKASECAGSVKFYSTSARTAPAEAALLILATDGPGAAAIMSYLRRIYHDEAGAPLTILARARSGHLKPKLIHIVRT